MHSVTVNLDGAQYLAGWRPEGQTIFLPALSESRVGDEVAVRVGIYGQTIRATLFGRISLVRRMGRPTLPPGVELHLDKESLPAAAWLFRSRASSIPGGSAGRPTRRTRATRPKSVARMVWP